MLLFTFHRASQLLWTRGCDFLKELWAEMKVNEAMNTFRACFSLIITAFFQWTRNDTLDPCIEARITWTCPTRTQPQKTFQPIQVFHFELYNAVMGGGLVHDGNRHQVLFILRYFPIVPRDLNKTSIQGPEPTQTWLVERMCLTGLVQTETCHFEDL